MKKKVSLVGLLALSLLLAATMTATLTAVAASDSADAHGWSYRVNAGDAIDIKTNTQTGYSDIQMLYANGAYNTSSIDVESPFRMTIKYDGLGTDWGPAFMLSGNSLSVNHFSGAGSKPVVGYNGSPESPQGWMESRIQWCSPKSMGETPIRLVNAASTGFYNGITGDYNGEKAYLAQKDNVKVRLGSTYDFLFEIEEKIGDAAAGTGSKLTLTETLKDGTTAQDVYYLEVKRDDFADHKAYLGMAAVAHSNDYLSIRVAQANNLVKMMTGGASLEELYINGVAQDASKNLFTAYYGDELKFKATGEGVLFRVGPADGVKVALAPAQDGYYYYYMANADTDIEAEAVSDPYFGVRYDTSGGSNVYAQMVKGGTAAPKPAYDPVKAGAVFKGWYTSDLSAPYDFSTPISEDTVICAKWATLCPITYHLEAFGARVKEVEEGEAYPELALRDFHIMGRSNNKSDYAEVNSLSVEWYRDEARTQKFDFTTKVSAATDVYGKLIETKRYAFTQAHGWDAVQSLKDSDNTVFMDSAFFRTVFDCTEDGAVLYNFTTPQNYGLYSRGLDVTRPIKMELQLRNGSKDGWSIYSFYDKYTLAQLAEAEGYDRKDAGARIGFGLSPLYGSFLDEAANFPTTEYGQKIKDYEQGKTVLFEIYIGETTADSYITVNGERAIELDVTRADFADGLAYANVAAFASHQARIKLYQDVQYTVTPTEGGSVTVEQRGAFTVLKAVPGAGYTFKGVTVNGKAAELEAESDYADLGDGEYLLLIEDYKPMTIAAQFEKGASGNTGDGETGGKKKGCGSTASAAGGAAAVLALSLCLSALAVRRKRAAKD